MVLRAFKFANSLGAILPCLVCLIQNNRFTLRWIDFLTDAINFIILLITKVPLLGKKIALVDCRRNEENPDCALQKPGAQSGFH